MASNTSLFLAAGQLRKSEADPEILEAYNRANGYFSEGNHKRDDWEKAQIASRSLFVYDPNNGSTPFVSFVSNRWVLKPDLDLVE